jgi:hypothetical protein
MVPSNNGIGGVGSDHIRTFIPSSHAFGIVLFRTWNFRTVYFAVLPLVQYWMSSEPLATVPVCFSGRHLEVQNKVAETRG